MKLAYRSLVEKALSLNYTVSVWDGEEWAVKRSTKPNEIYEAIKSVEQSELRFRDAAGEVVGWAMVIPDGMEPDETVADHNTYVESSPSSIKYQWMDQWSDEYMKAQA